MGESCIIIPQVRNTNGKLVDSILYRDLLDLTDNNRDSANYMYNKATEEEFNEKYTGTRDKYGQPIAEELAYQLFPKDPIIQEKKQFYNLFGKNTTFWDLDDIGDRLLEFNREGNYVAVAHEINGTVTVTLKKRSEAGIGERKLRQDISVNKTIIDYLESIGLGVEINSTYSTIHGVFNPFRGIDRTVNGLRTIIGIKDGQEGQEALPEEFAHYIVGAMCETIIGKRLLNQVSDMNVIQRILGSEFDTYRDLYKGDEYKKRMQYEAAGKLLYSHIIGKPIDLTEGGRSLALRTWNNFLYKCKHLTRHGIDEAIQKGLATAKSLVTGFESGGFDDMMSIVDAMASPTLYQIEETEGTGENDLANKVRAIKIAALKRSKERKQGHTAGRLQQIAINLYDILNQTTAGEDVNGKPVQNPIPLAEALKAIIPNLEQASAEYTQIINDINIANGWDQEGVIPNDAQDNFDMSTTQGLYNVANQLRDMQEYLNTYKNFLEYVNGLSKQELEISGKLTKDEVADVTGALASTKTQLRTVRDSIDYMESRVKFIRMRVLEQVFSPIISEVIKSSPERFNSDLFHRIWEEQDGDISRWSMLMDSAADSSSLLIGMVTKLVRQRQFRAGQRENSLLARIEAIHNKFRAETGKTDTSWIYQYSDGSDKFYYDKDENGNKVILRKGTQSGFLRGGVYKDADGQLVDLRYNAFAFMKAQRNAIIWAKLHSKSDAQYHAILDRWYKLNTTEITITVRAKDYNNLTTGSNSDGTHTVTRVIKVPNAAKYAENGPEMSEAEKSYWQEYMTLKFELDASLGITTQEPLKAVQVRQNSSEILFSKGDRKAKRITQRTKEEWKRNIDDLGFGAVPDSEDTEDYMYGPVSGPDGKVKKVVPTAYIGMLPMQQRQNLSVDATGALNRYATMTVQYSEMVGIADFMELVKDNATTMKINNSKSSKSKIFDENGNVIGEKWTLKHIIEKIKYNGNTEKQLSQKDFLESHTYEMLDGYIDRNIYGITKDDTAIDRWLDKLKQYTSFSVMGFNMFVGINNVLMGQSQQLLEVFAHEHIKSDSLVKADAFYFSHIAKDMAEYGKPNSTNTIGLLRNLFQVTQDYLTEQRYKEFYKSNIGRAFGKSSVYFMSSMGEHYLSTRTLLAVLNSTKVKITTGDTVKEGTLMDALEMVGMVEKDGKMTEQVIEPGKTVDGVVRSQRLRLKEGTTDMEGNAIDLFKVKDKIDGLNQAMNGIYNTEGMNAIQVHAWGRLVMTFRKWMIPHYNRRFKNGYYNTHYMAESEGFHKAGLEFLMTAISNYKGNIIKYWKILQSTKSGRQELANIRRSIGEIGITLALAVLLKCAWTKDPDTWAGKMALYQAKRLFMDYSTSWEPWSIITNFKNVINSPIPSINTLDDIMQLLRFSDMARKDSRGRNVWLKHTESNLPVLGPVIKAVHMDDNMFRIFDDLIIK